MLKQIDLFLPPRSQYQVLQAFTKSFSEALNRSGVRTRVLEAKKDRPDEFVDTILADAPDCTLSFNGLLPDERGNFFCDMIKIPHVACLVDAPQHFIGLTKSPRTIITCVDMLATDFFQGMNFKNALFMPHGVDRNLIYKVNPDQERPYDAVMLASFVDFEEIEKEWKKSALGKVWMDAARIFIKEKEISMAQAIAQAMDQHLKTLGSIDPRQIDFLLAMDQIEEYVNGKDRVDMLNHLEGIEIHLFGAGSDRWKKYVKSSITVHGPVSFQQAVNIMRQSKMVLNSRPAVKAGAHERVFLGLASGAAVVTNDNLYMQEHFRDKESLLLYSHGDWKQFNEVVHEYIKDNKKRLKLVEQGQELVKNNHTWDHRAATLLNELQPILKTMKQSYKSI